MKVISLVAVTLGVCCAARVGQAEPIKAPWILKSPGVAMRLDPGAGVPISYVIGDIAASKLTISQGILVDQADKSPWGPEGLKLCKNSSGQCEEIVSRDAGAMGSLWLRPVPKSAEAGHFSGVVTIISSLKPEGESVNVDVYVTSLLRQAIGAATIFASTLLAWIVSVWGRNRYDRAQALLPAAFDRQRLLALQAVLKQAPTQIASASFAATSNRIAALYASLDSDALENEGYVPPSVPSPFGGKPPRLDDYRQLLANVDK